MNRAKPGPFEPSLASLRTHRAPDWFEGAKLGIFIHWGLYSVPGWAPLPDETVLKVNVGQANPHLTAAEQRHILAHNPYAEWYLNTLKFEDSPTRAYHNRTYGPEFSYDGFAPIFKAASRAWDPESWAALFQASGARYVVLTAKHHDGFLLWPSRTPCPRKPAYGVERDCVGELAAAVRGRGLKMGVYYSGGLDWAFNPAVIDSLPGIFGSVIQEPEYAAYADAHWRELIERYEPSVLWNDIGYPRAADLLGLLSDYYNRVPDGAVNDRFRTTLVAGRPAAPHADYLTPEYAAFAKITPAKWETCRGLGYSFGFNRNDDDRTYLSTDELIRLFVDIVSKNGNLFLDVGPMADGTIPAAQRARLEGLGKWLAVNGEAVFDTRPWVRAEGEASDTPAVRFTSKAGALYALPFGAPPFGRLLLRGVFPPAEARVSLLGYSGGLTWTLEGDGLAVAWPEGIPPSPAYALKIFPEPRISGKENRP